MQHLPRLGPPGRGAATPAFQPAYAPRVCANCHGAEAGHYLASAHGLAARAGDAKAPSCRYCHGSAHQIKTIASNPDLGPARSLAFCGRCHAGKKVGQGRPPYAKADPETQLLAGVHGRINEKTGRLNATCADCHGAHDEQPAWAPSSPVNYRRVAATCGRCHPKEYDAYRSSIHAAAATAGAKEAPTCESCHGSHNVVTVLNPPPGEDNWTEDVALCSGCHTSAALAAKFGMSTAPAATFARTYHGVVRAGGKKTAADCGACHRVHAVLPSADPRAATNAGRLADTCGRCHPGAGARFYATNVHKPLAGFYGAPGRVVSYIYIPLIILVIGGMLLHNALDYLKKVRTIRAAQLTAEPPVRRLSLLERLQHILLLLSFGALGYTGFTIKWPAAWFAAWLVRLEGPFPLRSTIHKSAATVLIVTAVFHLCYILFTKVGRRRLRAIWPRLADARDAAYAVLHNLGVKAEAPELDEFSYAEKAEYWALVWGTAIMAATGLYVWLDPVIHRLFPFWLYGVMRTIHLYEAILAILAIVVWHFYAIIFDPSVYPMNLAWLDGKVPAALLRREKGKWLRQREEEETAKRKAEEEAAAESEADGEIAELTGDKPRSDK